jgi:hypothetical protein
VGGSGGGEKRWIEGNWVLENFVSEYREVTNVLLFLEKQHRLEYTIDIDLKQTIKLIHLAFNLKKINNLLKTSVV